MKIVSVDNIQRDVILQKEDGSHLILTKSSIKVLENLFIKYFGYGEFNKHFVQGHRSPGYLLNRLIRKGHIPEILRLAMPINWTN